MTKWRYPQTAVAEYNAVLLSGILLGVGYTCSSLWFCVFIAFLPLLWSIQNLRSLKQFVWRIFLSFFCYHGIANWWIGSWQPKADPFLILSSLLLWIVHPFFFLLPWLGFWFVWRKRSFETAVASFPFFFTSFEWLHSLGEFGYPWLSIGYSMLPWSTGVQMADLGGVWLLSFWILCINTLIWKACRSLYEQSLRSFLSMGLLLFACLLFPSLYGSLRLDQLNQRKPSSQLTVAIVQANVDPWKKWEELSPDEQLRLHLQLSDSARTLADTVHLIVWGETAIPFWITWDRYRREYGQLRNWVDTANTAILTGFPDLVFFSQKVDAEVKPFRGDSVFYQTYNAALLLQRCDTPQIYHKIRLTPFAERIPYQEYFAFLEKWISWGVGISSWGKGEAVKNFTLCSPVQVKFGPIICLESIFPAFVRQFALQGAKFITIISNDGWFLHTPGPRQHYAIAQMRAIEIRRPIVRCANTGISGIILPTGKSAIMSKQGAREIVIGTVPLQPHDSVYLRFGDWLPIASTVIAVLLLGECSVRKRNFHKEGGARTRC